MTVDWIGQLLLIPQAAGKNFPASVFDQFLHGVRDTARIFGVAVRIQNKHGFENVLRQLEISVAIVSGGLIY